jgi:hypothetical protein
MSSKLLRAGLALLVVGLLLSLPGISSAMTLGGGSPAASTSVVHKAHKKKKKKLRPGCRRVRIRVHRKKGAKPRKPRFRIVCKKPTTTTETPSTGTPTSPAGPAFKDQTKLSLACATPVEEGNASHCVATLTDEATSKQVLPAASKVTFEAGAAHGTFAPAAECTLVGDAASASCAVDYTAAGHGTDTLRAHFAGDQTHQAADSAATEIAITEKPIVKDNTTTTIECTSPVEEGTASTCKAKVVDAASIKQGNLNGQKVIFVSTPAGGTFTPAAECTLSGNATEATCSVTYKAATHGSESIRAGFVGDLLHNASQSAGVPVVTTEKTVVTDSTATSLSCQTPVEEGISSNCTATVADTATTKQGNLNGQKVSFSATPTGGTFSPAAECTLVGNASSATCQVSYKAAVHGTATVKTKYAGDPVHKTSESTGFSIVTTEKPAGKDNTATAISCTSPVEEGVASTCKATVTDSATTKQGTLNGVKVTFSASPAGGTFTPAAECTLSGNATEATCSVTYKAAAAGTEAIAAHYAGDSVHNASESAGARLVTTEKPVVKDTTATSLTCTSPVEEGTASTCAAKVTDSATTKQGNLNGQKVSFEANPVAGTFSAAECTLAGNATEATCSVTYKATAVGTETIKAKYAGDSLHKASESAGAAVVTTAKSGAGKLPNVPAGDELADLVTHQSFEDATDPNFKPISAADGSVATTTTSPIEGSKSLAVVVKNFGRVGFYYQYGFEQGPNVDTATTRVKLRVDSTTGTATPLKLCTIVYIAGNPHSQCETLSVTNHSVVEPFIAYNAEGKKIERAYFQFTVEASGTVNLTLDDAHLFIVQKIGSGGGGGGGEEGGGGGDEESEGQPTNCKPSQESVPSGPPSAGTPCADIKAPPVNSPYEKTTVNLPAARPYISLDSYKQAPTSSPVYKRFKEFVDGVVADPTEDLAQEYSPSDGVVMFARTGEAKYIESAIKFAQKYVEAEAAKIAAGQEPTIADDHYLDIGEHLEDIALTYDWGYSRLTEAQRTSWKNFGDKVLSNLWSPWTSTWNGTVGSAPDTGWSLNNPGNNYYYSFIKATQMWAIAMKSTPWIEFLQKYKFPLSEAYFAELPGGGSREGTGYGVSQRVNGENARMWRASTGEDLKQVRQRMSETAEYWINATVPTLNYYAPIGDLSRQSQPGIYDYHLDLMHEASAAMPNSAATNHALWWLQHNIHNTIEREPELGETPHFRQNLMQALVTGAGTATEPTALDYHATGVGQFFGRSSWSTSASWFQMTAGPYDESHAHQDQGGFTLYHNTWLTVTSNIWSQSGLEGGGAGAEDLNTAVNNVVRFNKGSTVIPQNNGVSTTSSETLGDGTYKVKANLTPAYSKHSSEVVKWERELLFKGNDLKVNDSCQVGTGVNPVFQLHVPVQPTNQGGGVIKAGTLTVTVPSTYTASFVNMTSQPGEFSKGWRIDLTNPANTGASNCSFAVDLNS